VNVRDAIERGDFKDFLGAMDPHVVWRAVGEEEPGCRNRDEVRSVFEDWMEQGFSGRPEIVVESDDRIVVDPHVDPPPPDHPGLHHVFTLRDGLIAEIQDYPDRASALGAVEQ
jgi:ketosteroid isomerase-like protein